MADSVSVTSHHSYGSRVGNSFKSILWWLFLVIISIVLLSRNENNYVKQKAALKEWARIVQEATIDQINSGLEWKEIHVSWETASNAEALKDDTFWITTDDLKLKRTVEMYQWYEDSHEECHDNMWWSEDCETTYTYDKKWSDEHISSNNFYQTSNHENPSTREYESNERIKEPITLWAYTLTPIFIDQLTNYKTINLSEQDIKIPEKYKLIENQNTASNGTVEDNNNNYLYWDSQNTTTASNEKFHINGDQIYIGTDPTSPEIWDLRIAFSSLKPWTISIIWKQVWNELSSYTVSNWRHINLLEQWNVTAEDMFLHAQKANEQMTWIIRLIWLLLMYCGFAAMFKFIETLAKVLPFLANIIWVWTGIIALGLTIIVWFVTIWIARLVARPIVWICCLVVAAWGIFLLRKSKKDNKGTLPKQENIEEKAEKVWTNWD